MSVAAGPARWRWGLVRRHPPALAPRRNPVL